MDVAAKKQGSGYRADALVVMKGLEAVRKRPGMYIGDNGTRGLTHLVYEILDNSVDEALTGHCSTIHLTLHADGSVSVHDDGRGIPVDVEPTSGVPGAILVMTELHAGGKFGGGGYEVAGGLHGVGASVVNALSSRLDLQVDRDGHTHAVSFRAGEPGHFDGDVFTPSTTVRVVGDVPAGRTGTRTRFWPDPDLFLPDARIDVAAVTARARQTAFLVPGLRICFRDETGEQVHEETFCFDGGIADLVAFRATDVPLAQMAPLRLAGSGTFVERVPVMVDGKQVIGDVERTCHVDVALRWGVGFDPDVTSFVNIVHTPAGGTHVAGFERALVKTLSAAVRDLKVAKAKDPALVKDDVLEGLTAVVVVKLAEPQFVGQTKDELGTPAVAGIVASVVAEQLGAWVASPKSKQQVRAVLEKAQQAARTRMAAREIREVRRRKTALENASMPSKLADCRSEDVEETELFIVEGDSALGTFKMGRDARFQAALPIRGKILNTHGAGQARMLANEECAAIIQVLGAGFGKSFTRENLRYGKLIALCDADVDGAHIRSLLMTFVYRYLRPLLEDGRFYSAVPPLHRIAVVGSKDYVYTYSDAELHAQTARLEAAGKKIKEVQRYKGLGEMDADQLAETTLDPAHRHLRRITMDDAAAAAAAFDLCMGPDVGPRREFIMAEGGLLDADLVDA
jgi:DNA gyrase subunit B